MNYIKRVFFAFCLYIILLETTSANLVNSFGRPVHILRFDEANKAIDDYSSELNKIFLHPDVLERKIVVFSIIGAFRRGKSFFLDYCLRFMYANYPSINNLNNQISENSSWIGPEDEPLIGFSWRSGTQRDTTGIIMWSDVFLHTRETTGEKIAIILMDTQGLFDTKSSPADNSRIFALGTLISSFQIFNLVGIIQEDQLQYLQFATEFARFAAQDSQDGKPFQNLLFLIRDWNNPGEYEYGTEGGAEYLKTVLEINDEQNNELRSVRQFLSSSFDQMQCCLFPYPGKVVALKKNYDGRWKSMDEEFKDELMIIIEKLLKPENLVLKKINGKHLTSIELREYIESYFKLFASDTLPQPQSVYELTIEKQMNILIRKCLDTYKENIAQSQNLVEERNIHIFHEMSKSKTLIMFTDEEKMGNSEHERKYKAQLEAQIEKLYLEWKKPLLKHLNELKEAKTKNEEALEAERKLREEMVELERKRELELIEEAKYNAQKELLMERERANEAATKAAKAELEAVVKNLRNAELNRKLEAERERCSFLWFFNVCIFKTYKTD